MVENPPASSWSPELAAHLLSRAGFGGTPDEVMAVYRKGRARAVEELLLVDEDSDLFPPPAFGSQGDRIERVKQLRMVSDPMEKKRLQDMERKQQREELFALRQWWLQRMRYTSSPLREKMTLFWHGHFAASFDKVNVAYAMWQQNETFRAHALGNFRELTREISHDPAMMRYLDLQQSDRSRPNENFARELMELFMLGEGVKYTEKDVQEAARAFTGYRINPGTLQFRFVRGQFDDTEKVFMGQQGNFTGDEVIEIICKQPECSRFIARKVWDYFAGTPASPVIEQQLANAFYFSRYDISVLVKNVLLHPAFYSPAVVRRQVKSPVQWLVQTSRVLEAPLPPIAVSEFAMRQMGQVIFAPPNVKGWEGGRSWINASTYLFRCNFSGELINGDNPRVEGAGGMTALDIPWDRIAPQEVRSKPEILCDQLSFRLIGGSLKPSDRRRFVKFLEDRGPVVDETTVRDLVHLMMSTPEYQLT